jgi:lipopolysaccharide transport system ATP-binding protein
MSDAVIQARGLSKRYRLGGKKTYRTLRESITRAAVAPLRLVSSRREREEAAHTFWALRDVSFDVNQGDVLGVVGRNGAGKSTLLKVLSRIVEPTSGEATIIGRVGSLLEVGTGFHPELTGRENVFLNGAILGMKRQEIAAKFDEIVEFAEVERFIDTPVKHYSSGMGLRLGFAVAAHLEPEILVIDEVLAVGDASFQKKCLGKMGDVAKQGRTVLFVSHNMAAVRSLCNRALMLQDGQVVCAGAVDEVVDFYLGGSSGALSEHRWEDTKTAPGNGQARLRGIRVVDSEGATISQAPISSSIGFEIEYEVLSEGAMLNLSLAVYTQENVHVFASISATDQAWFSKPHPLGRYRSRCTIPANFFNEGRYLVTIRLMERARHVIGLAEQVVAVDFIDLGEHRGGYFGRWNGAVRPLLPWRTETANSTAELPATAARMR